LAKMILAQVSSHWLWL